MRRRVVAAVGEHLPQEPGDRQPVFQPPPAVEEAAGAEDGFALVGGQAVQQQIVVESRPQPDLDATSLPEHEQGLVAEAAERRPQCPGQADGVLGIFQGAEQVEKVVNLLLGEEGPAADEVVIEPVMPQRLSLIHI